MANVSFIVTSYNYENYIVETIKSIQNQTLAPFEIIVVDDFSEDNSLNILRKIKGIKLIEHKSNLGQLAAIISGLKFAKGDYICIVDSDDVLKPEFSERLVKYFKNKEIKLVNCNCKKSEMISTKTHEFGGWWWSPMSCAMFKKEAIDCVLDYEYVNNWRICPDKFLFNLAYLQGNSMNVAEELVYKREHNCNAGKTKFRLLVNIKNNFKIRKEILRIIKDKKKRIIVKNSYLYLFKQIFNKIFG